MFHTYRLQLWSFHGSSQSRAWKANPGKCSLQLQIVYREMIGSVVNNELHYRWDIGEFISPYIAISRNN